MTLSVLIRAFSDVEKPFLFSDLAKSENKKGFSTSEKVRIMSVHGFGFKQFHYLIIHKAVTE